MTTFNIKQNDTSPAILYALTPTDVDLTAASVEFRYRPAGDEGFTTKSATVVTATGTPTVRYDWETADTASVGDFEAEFVVTYADASVETFPNSSYIYISIIGQPENIYTITAASVLDGFATSAPLADVAGYIAIIDQADACLAAKNVSGAIGQQLKILGVRYLIEGASDKVDLKEERAVSGASRAFAEREGGETGTMKTLRRIDQHGCVLSVISRNGRVQLRSVGRRAPVTATRKIY